MNKLQRAQGFAQQGGKTVITAGITSVTLVQASFPRATITVFYTGTTGLALIYSNNLQFPTPLPNPFTADANGHWYFYAPNGRYDVMIASPQLGQPWTIGDLLLNDSPGGSGPMAQTPWLSNIDGGGFNLSNVGFIDVSGGYLINGVPMANPNLWIQVPSTANIYHQGFIGVANTSPNYAVDVVGGVNVTDNYYVKGVAIATGADNDPWIVLSGSRIQYNGQVGISIAPTHALDVVGDVNITGQYFINGVATGGTGGGPWIVLTGSRINYNGQVGINNSSPGFALDVVGGVNVTTGFFINGVALTAGSGAWLPSPTGGGIFFNGGPVGIGIQVAAVPLQVIGGVSAGQYAMNTNPTIPVINQNGAFVGAGVDVTGGGGFGIKATYMQANGNITSTQVIEATSGFGIAGFAGPGNTVINSAGAFVGAGVDVTGGVGFGIKATYIQANGNVVANTVSGVASSGYVEAAAGFVIPAFTGPNGVVINTAGAFVGAGVAVGNYGVGCGAIVATGPLECQSGPLTGHPNAAIFANGDVLINGNCAANTFALYSNPAAPVINSAGAFVGAGVAVGTFGISCAYVQSNGNVVANGGFLEASSGLVINGTTVINSAGQWLGGMTINPPIAVNGNIAGATFSLFNNQANPIINTAGAFVGAGVAVGSFGVSCAYLQSNGNVVSNGGVLESSGGVVISGFTGQTVINSAGAFVGAGVAVGSYGISCAYLQSNGNVVSNGGFVEASSGVVIPAYGTVINSVGQWTGPAIAFSIPSPLTVNGNIIANGGYLEATSGVIVAGSTVIDSNRTFVGNGVQAAADIFGALFGIQGVSTGATWTATFTDTGGADHTLFVRGGIICVS